MPYIPPHRITEDTMIEINLGNCLWHICKPICIPKSITDKAAANICVILKIIFPDAIPVSIVCDIKNNFILSLHSFHSVLTQKRYFCFNYIAYVNYTVSTNLKFFQIFFTHKLSNIGNTKFKHSEGVNTIV